MITIRRASERGHANHGWLDSYHSFSFADYFDPRHMGFRALRVINEDWIEPSKGFGTHPHRDMEIITYILEGSLQHKDSMGMGSVIRKGDVQHMSAGTGVAHSEFNPSQSEPVHLLQIWILPSANGIRPSYHQKTFPRDEMEGRLQLVASGDGREGSLTIAADATLYAGLFRKGARATLELAPGRHAWVHVAQGSLRVNNLELQAGDALALSDEQVMHLEGVDEGEVLVFDLA